MRNPITNHTSEQGGVYANYRGKILPMSPHYYLLDVFFCQVLQYSRSRTIVLLKKLKPLKKLPFQKRRWSCDFPQRKTPVAQKHRAISRQEILQPPPPLGCFGTPLPLPQSLCGRTDGRTCARTDGHVTITSQPKFLGSIGYQICLAMELRYKSFVTFHFCIPHNWTDLA